MSEFEFKDHYLKFYISGIEEPFIFHVSEAEFERGRGIEVLDIGDPMMQFFCFDTVDSRSVAVSLRDVEMIQYLWEPIYPMPSEVKLPEGELDQDSQEYEDRQNYEVRLYFRDRKEPHVCGSSNPEDLHSIMLSLDGGSFVEHPYLVFGDEDDEEISFNAQHLQLITLPAEGLREGLRMFLAAD